MESSFLKLLYHTIKGGFFVFTFCQKVFIFCHFDEKERILTGLTFLQGRDILNKEFKGL